MGSCEHFLKSFVELGHAIDPGSGAIPDLCLSASLSRSLTREDLFFRCSSFFQKQDDVHLHPGDVLDDIQKGA